MISFPHALNFISKLQVRINTHLERRVLKDNMRQLSKVARTRKASFLYTFSFPFELTEWPQN